MCYTYVLMKRNFLSVCWLLVIASVSHAESRFEPDPAKDLVTGGASLGLFIPSLFVHGEPGTQQPLDSLNSLDRAFMTGFGQAIDTAGSLGAYLALALPAVSLLGQDTFWKPALTYALMYAEAFMLTSGTKDLLKAGISRYRPYTYFGEVPPGLKNDYYNSFPSGHTAFAFLGAAFLTITFSLEYPGSPWKIPLIAGGYTLAAAVAVFRIASGSHFLTDVLAGAAIGSLFGYLVPVIHLKGRMEKADLQPVLTGSGFGFHGRF